MSNGIKNSNLVARIITITLLISLFFFLGLSLPGNAYGDSKGGMVIADADDDVNEVDDDVNEVDDDVNEVDDDIDDTCEDDCTDINCTCTDDVNCTCVDDCGDANDNNKAKNANSNSASDNANKADDCVDVNGICSDDDCDCTDVNGKCADDCIDVNNANNVSKAEKTKNTNNNSAVTDDALKGGKNINTNSSSPLEVMKIRETKTLDDSLELKSIVPVPISEVEANQQLGAKGIIKLFFENVTLFFTNLLDKII
jgi:hypothetical protein